jgi:hypothetical protein
MAVEFKHTVKHGRLQFHAGPVYGFKDARAEEYFVKAGFADKSNKKAMVTLPKGSVEIDPETVFANSGGKKVLA